MRYKRFIIKNYRAINGPLEIKVERCSLNPIVGVNESGKTTILHALFAFDYYNDAFNEQVRHLKDIANLYHTSSLPATIEAEIELTKRNLQGVISDAISNCPKENVALKSELSVLSRKRALPVPLTICRNLNKRTYSISPNIFGTASAQHAIACEIIRNLPYILYFDDFRDKVDARIEIPAAEPESLSGWLAILEQLFVQTDKSFSVFNLASQEERFRKTVLAKVERKLNGTLTREWQHFRLDNRDALKISIDFEREGSEPVKNYIRLDVVEKDVNGDEHFFFISDRSKGFYWFFNFVMKLEFNPKLVADFVPSAGEADAIYLLDEPGSYLHAFAQRKLCQKLCQISEKSWVAYCTHSHYLLDPEFIPVNRIKVAEKDGNGNVDLIPIMNYHRSSSENRSALQPVLDALQIKPFALDLISTNLTLITEGIYDYFAIEMFRGDMTISILPSVGADSIKFYVSLMIAWNIDFRALWDNDPDGRKYYEQAVKCFGDEIANKHFRLLPSHSTNGRRIMQNLFEGQDLVNVRLELGLQSNCSFDHTLHALFYSSRRDELVNGMSQTTKRNFEELFEALSLKI